jgi:hypothetical protein
MALTVKEPLIGRRALEFAVVDPESLEKEAIQVRDKLSISAGRASERARGGERRAYSGFESRTPTLSLPFPS